MLGHRLFHQRLDIEVTRGHQRAVGLLDDVSTPGKDFRERTFDNVTKLVKPLRNQMTLLSALLRNLL